MKLFFLLYVIYKNLKFKEIWALCRHSCFVICSCKTDFYYMFTPERERMREQGKEKEGKHFKNIKKS